MKLTQDRLKELLDYDPETGVFIWKIDLIKQKTKEKIAGCLHKNSGYHHITINGHKHKAHRLAFLYMEGYFPENQIDHIDRNRSNNRWDNLREVSRTCNARNSNIPKNNKSGVVGVCWHKLNNKWISSIMVFGRTVHLGYFDNIIEAAKARWEAELKYGFPNCNTTSSAYNYLKERGAI